MAGAFAPLEGERLADLEACGSAEVGSAAEADGERGISPEQVALRAGPKTVEDLKAAVLLIKIGIAVAGETPSAVGDAKMPDSIWPARGISCSRMSAW